jgi:hypothetical protein
MGALSPRAIAVMEPDLIARSQFREPVSSAVPPRNDFALLTKPFSSSCENTLKQMPCINNLDQPTKLWSYIRRYGAGCSEVAEFAFERDTVLAFLCRRNTGAGSLAEASSLQALSGSGAWPH